jgi:hypothetical protein
MRHKRCENCRYFQPCEEGAAEGECHRYAPIPQVGGARRVNWPASYADEWCGEWALCEVQPTPEEPRQCALWPPCHRCKQSPCECEEPKPGPEGDGDDLPEPPECNW